jgi:fructan beta-fructosidase
MTKETTLEKFRPAMHFSPARNWINDPNGLVYYKGEYHMFYQHHPHSMIWGPMHWGHAVSKDLTKWEELPIALYPDELGAIFSGSAVVDKNNTSGLKSGEEDVMVAIFTHHGEDNEKQSIAYSNDRGRTWVKYEGNPVIPNPGLKDFRDPKVFWHEGSSKWIMSLACGDHIRFYGSLNLIDCEYLSSFGKTCGAHGGVWECPDLIHLDVEGEDLKKWVLIVSLNPGGPNGGSAIQYFTGEFDGTTFVTDMEENEEKWADWGRDFYAAVTWSGTEKPLWIGWMTNWQYANVTPNAEFRGSMSLARHLSLGREDGKYVLIQQPFLSEELESKPIFARQNGSFEDLTVKLPGQPFMVDLNLNTSSSFSLSLKGEGTEVKIIFDREAKELKVDRTKSGLVEFSNHFPSVDVMPLNAFKDGVILVDKSSVEVFVNGGRSVMTETFFPSSVIDSVEFQAFNSPVEYKQIGIQSISM